MLQHTLLQPELSWQDKIAYLAWKISQNGGVRPEDIEVRHIFEPGRYIRELELPAQFVFIGNKHKQGHLVELLQGSAKLITDKRSTVYHAIDRIVTPVGFTMVAYTITSCLVRSIHLNPNESRDVEQLEAEHFEPVQSLLVHGKDVWRRLLL